MRLFKTGIAWMFLMSFLAIQPRSTQASAGLPDSPYFGYGALLELRGKNTDLAINAAAGLGLDWIAIELDWAHLWPVSDVSPDYSLLSNPITHAAQNGLKVLISVTHAPGWAMQAHGPDPLATAELVVHLARLYPGAVEAIELFPGANTSQGWGVHPDPAAYADLFHSVQSALKQIKHQVTLIGAGLTPLPAGSNPDDIEDLAFLSSLYEYGAAEWMPVVSLNFPTTELNPTTSPQGPDAYVLRRYELIRQAMLENQHRDGLIWITKFSPPQQQNNPDDQTSWMVQSYELLRAQLFIGAAFFDGLNIPEAQVAAQQPAISLVGENTSLHPLFSALANLISETKNQIRIQFSLLVSKYTYNRDFPKDGT